MRQHARPMPRPSHRRRRVGLAAVVAAAVLLTVAALASRSAVPSVPSASLAADPTAVTGSAPTPSGTARPAASAAPSSVPTQQAVIVEGPVATFYPAHVGLDSWPRPTPPPIDSLTGYVWPLAHPRLTLPVRAYALGLALRRRQAVP